MSNESQVNDKNMANERQMKTQKSANKRQMKKLYKCTEAKWQHCVKRRNLN